MSDKEELEKGSLDVKGKWDNEKGDVQVRAKIIDDETNQEFEANVKVSEESKTAHIDYTDPSTGKPVSCDIDDKHRSGVGDSDACRVLQTVVSTSRQAFRGH